MRDPVLRKRWLGLGVGVCCVAAAFAGLRGRGLVGVCWPASARANLQRVVLPRPASPPPSYSFTEAPGVVDAAADKLPAQVMVYAVARKAATRDVVCELASSLGVTVSAERYASLPETMEDGMEDGREYSVTLGEAGPTSPGDLQITAADDGNYMISVESQVPMDEKDREALSDEATAASARDFLATSGLLPERCEFAHVQEADSTEFTEAGRQKRVVLGKHAVYYRYLDGIQDGTFGVTVNGAGRVYHIRRNMRNIVPLQSHPILSPREAVDALKSGQAVVAGPSDPGKAYSAIIETVELVYYEGAAGLRIDTIQPIYRFEGRVEGHGDRFSAQLSAVRPEYLEPVGLPSPG